MPAVTLGLAAASQIARFTRSSVLEVLRQSYMRTARAKGASWPRRIRWHALPNAAIPTLTVLGFQFGLMIAGTVVIETVFAWPGMGRLFYQAVNARDYAVVQTIILLIAVSIIVINLMVDLLYAVLDPRVRLTGVTEMAVTDQSDAIIVKPPSFVKRVGLDRPWIVIFAGVYLGLVVLVAIFAPLLQPYDHAAQDLFEIRNPPVFMGGDWNYILGSDDLGRDVLSRVIYGTKISVVIALVGTGIGAVLGRSSGLSPRISEVGSMT